MVFEIQVISECVSEHGQVLVSVDAPHLRLDVQERRCHPSMSLR